VFGVEDQLRKAQEEFLRILWEERNGEGVDGKLNLVGGRRKRNQGESHTGKDLLSWQESASK